MITKEVRREKDSGDRDSIDNFYTVFILIIYACFTYSKKHIKGNIDKHTEKDNRVLPNLDT